MTDRAPLQDSVFKVPILKDKTHFFFFLGSPKCCYLILSALASFFCDVWHFWFSCPFTLWSNTSLLDRGSPSLSRKNNRRAGLCLSSSMVKRNAEKYFSFSQISLSSLIFLMLCWFAGTHWGGHRQCIGETFSFGSFLLLFSLCPSHHWLTSYCQSLHPILGDAVYSHFRFNHSLWGLEGNLEVTKPSSHRSSVFSSCNRQCFGLSVDTCSRGKCPVLQCSPSHYRSTPDIRDLSFNGHLSSSDTQPLLRLSSAVQNKFVTC